jgi:hypothetical protein
MRHLPQKVHSIRPLSGGQTRYRELIFVNRVSLPRGKYIIDPEFKFERVTHLECQSGGCVKYFGVTLSLDEWIEGANRRKNIHDQFLFSALLNAGAQAGNQMPLRGFLHAR